MENLESSIYTPLGTFSRNTRHFIIYNYLVIFFAAALFIKQLAVIHEVNTYFLAFPKLISPILFSATTSALIFLPFLYIKRRQFVWLTLLSLLVSTLMILGLTYFHFFGSIPSVALLGIISQTDDVGSSVAKAFLPTDLFYLLDIPIGYLLAKKVKPQSYEQKEIKPLYKAHMVAPIIVISTLLLLHLIDPNKNLGFVKNTLMDNRIALENYGVLEMVFFDAFRTYNINFQKLSESERERIKAWAASNMPQNKANPMTGVSKNKNIIMIQVESLQSFPLGNTVEGQEVTPSLNQFMNQSHYFDNHYFEIGGGNTSDTDFVANTSYYPLKEAAAFVKYGHDDFTSLPKELKEEGYIATAYHAYYRGFWNRNIAFRSLGYDNFFGNEAYTGARFINMGIDDKSFLVQTADKLKEQKSPSFNYMITLSNHFPFHLEDDLKGLKLTKSRYPELSHNYLNTLNYTDRALGDFFAELKKQGLYDEATIIIYGDHYAKIDSFDLDNYHFDSNKLEDKQVPLLIKLPNQTEKIVHEEISSHIDLMPTILNLVGAKVDSLMFGTDLFGDTKPFYSAVSYFDTETIIGYDLIYRLQGLVESCQIWGQPSVVNRTLDCINLINRKRESQEISGKIIRYNLYNHLKR